MERRWEIWRILFSMSNTHCLSKLRSGARRDAMLSIINEHASRMPLDNLSGLHATRDKLLWQGQYRKLPLVCNQELELFLNRKYLLSPVDTAGGGDEFKSNSSSGGSPTKFVQTKLHAGFVVEKFKIMSTYMQHVQSELHQQTW